jgi:hypothetical protein
LPDEDIKVIYILGWVRSGTTLLDTMLGELDGFFSSGELRYIWDRGLQFGYLCGCGRPHLRCPVWSAVIERAFGLSFRSELDPEKMTRDRFSVMRTYRLVGNLRRRPPGPFGWSALDGYTRGLARLYQGIKAVTGARVVVDSSKFAQDAAVVRLLEGVEPYFVHLVRDARGVAYSNLRVKTSQPDPDRPVDMERMSPLRSALRWSRFNLAAEAVRFRSERGRSMFLRYEDLIADPRGAIDQILAMIGIRAELSMFVDDDIVRLGENHTVWGNPGRFQRGATRLRLDDEWITQLPARDRRLTNTIALPLLLRYGYVPARRVQTRR